MDVILNREKKRIKGNIASNERSTPPVLCTRFTFIPTETNGLICKRSLGYIPTVLHHVFEKENYLHFVYLFSISFVANSPLLRPFVFGFQFNYLLKVLISSYLLCSLPIALSLLFISVHILSVTTIVIYYYYYSAATAGFVDVLVLALCQQQ